MTVDPLDPTPLWQQLANVIRDQIKAGEYAPRQMLPSEAHMQQEHDVSRGTVRRAMKALGEQGWVTTIQGRGSYVRPAADWPES
ncbi:GntR family transcriptional regulator [Nonomuraea lactucae]|uniref:GntR family transcriptional regulator n=1 Tax=Nonomuraea lactucae TaxID=2249762 RepID=UPI000DE25358|nr:GntR family transcriptional regulator [Nonomuraea lactucae]